MLRLQQTYQPAGRNGVAAAIAQRLAGGRLDGTHYLLADPSFAPIAGDIEAWPTVLTTAQGWEDLDQRDWAPAGSPAAESSAAAVG